MPEYEATVADAIYALADAVNRLAGVAAWSAAAEHSDTHGRQKEMAAVIFRFAKDGYFTAKVNGKKVSEADQDMLDRMFYGIFPHADPKKLPKR